LTRRGQDLTKYVAPSRAWPYDSLSKKRRRGKGAQSPHERGRPSGMCCGRYSMAIIDGGLAQTARYRAAETGGTLRLPEQTACTCAIAAPWVVVVSTGSSRATKSHPASCARWRSTEASWTLRDSRSSFATMRTEPRPASRSARAAVRAGRANVLAETGSAKWAGTQLTETATRASGPRLRSGVPRNPVARNDGGPMGSDHRLGNEVSTVPGKGP